MLPNIKKLKLRFLACLMVLFITPIYIWAASNYFFKHIDINNGLSSNAVLSILQDRRGFIWLGTKDGLNRYDGTSFKVFNKSTSNLVNNFVNVVFEDNDGNLWTGTEHGVYLFNMSTESFSYLNAPIDRSGKTLDGSIRCIAQDRKGNIYISSDYQGVYTYDRERKTLHRPFGGKTMQNVNAMVFGDDRAWLGISGVNLYVSDRQYKSLVPFVDPKGQQPFKNLNFSRILVTKRYVYVATEQGLYAIDIKLRDVKTIVNGFYRTLCLNADGSRLWAGSQTGIHIIDTRLNIEVDHLTMPDIDNPFALADDAIYSILCDREGSMWVGSFFGGINFLSAQNINFEKYYPQQGMEYMGRRVREICQDASGRIWFGTEDKGLFCFDTKTGNIQHVKTDLRTVNIHGLCVDGDYLWVGAFDGGLERIGLKDGSRKTYFASSARGGLCSDYVFSVFRQANGTLWIGTTSGLMRYDAKSGSFVKEPHLGSTFVYQITEDHDGTLLIATYSDGMFTYDPIHRKWKHYSYSDGKAGSIPDSKVISIFEDSKHRIWVITQNGGLSLLDKDNGTFKPYPLEKSGYFDIVFKVVEDNDGRLWCSTNSGLVCITNVEKGQKRYFTTANGLLNNHFNYQSGFKDKNGYLYFGTIDGLIRFNPRHFYVSKVKTQIAFSDLYIMNKLMMPGAEKSPIDINIDECKKLVLSHDQNSFSIAARVLSYLSSEPEMIEYKLDGYDDWKELSGTNRNISYSNLPYGHYTLRVRALGSIGEHADERTMEIVINPPFYWSTIAKLFYLLVVIFILYKVYSFDKRRKEAKLALMKTKIENEKEKEYYEAKINFFTNMAHEIRTPLTLIKSPLENILQRKDLSPDVTEDLMVMNNNTNRLMSLIGQLLDFRKIESTKNISLNMEQTNISLFIKSIIQNFSHAIAARNITLKTNIESDIMSVTDQDVLTKIVSNIMSNAMKYASSYIEVTLRTESGNIILTETNDGEIVPEDKRETIFKPFYRYEGGENRNVVGTGIGLSLTRRLAELLQGTIRMGDNTDANSFILTLPVVAETSENAPQPTVEKEKPTQAKDAEESTPAPDNNTNLLFVEDNDELLPYLKRYFSKKYKVFTASNGSEALDVLNHENINLVVSDIMMPVMDGLELCRTIKENVQYSHIPVILLTAKTTLQSRLDGLREGADAYIDKPFSMKYLEEAIESILKNRQRLYASFSNNHETSQPLPTQGLSKAEEKFLNELKEQVDKDMGDPDYNVDRLAESLNMSRSSLNRKLKGSLNMTPNDYIRIERLKRAMELLKSREYRVNEVCYIVGFNTPSYFSKCFYNQFGMLPKDV